MRNLDSINGILYTAKDFVADARAIAHAVEKLLDQATPADRATLHRLGQAAWDLAQVLAIELARLPSAREERSANFTTPHAGTFTGRNHISPSSAKF